MVKRILFIITCALNITMALHAQVFTQSEVDSYGPVANEAIHDEMYYYNLKANYNIRYWHIDKMLIFTYTLTSSSAFQLSDVFNAFNIEAVKDKVIKGIIKKYMDDDQTGKQLESFVYRLKKLGIPIIVKCQYKKEEKSATATPAEIQKLASLFY